MSALEIAVHPARLCWLATAVVRTHLQCPVEIAQHARRRVYKRWRRCRPTGAMWASFIIDEIRAIQGRA